MRVSEIRRALAACLLVAVACGGDNPGLTTGLTGAPPTSGGSGESSSAPTDGGHDSDDSDAPGDTDCDGDSPAIPPKNPSPACAPDVPCVSDANCPDGHACNLALEPPACALLFCGAAGTACHDASVCADGMQCHDGRCNPCTFCGDLCEVDFQSDPAHCGCCDNPVPEGHVCQGGEPTCPAGQAPCGAACVDLDSDPAHCGACDAPVPDGLGCAGGQPVCLDGLAMCDGACVDLASDADNCGACGASCPFGICAQPDLCELTVSIDEAPLPVSCDTMCEAAGLQCAEDVLVGEAIYEGRCDSQLVYIMNCGAVPGVETEDGACGNICTCTLTSQTCDCRPKPP